MLCIYIYIYIERERERCILCNVLHGTYLNEPYPLSASSGLSASQAASQSGPEPEPRTGSSSAAAWTLRYASYGDFAGLAETRLA